MTDFILDDSAKATLADAENIADGKPLSRRRLARI